MHGSGSDDVLGVAVPIGVEGYEMERSDWVQLRTLKLGNIVKALQPGWAKLIRVWLLVLEFRHDFRVPVARSEDCIIALVEVEIFSHLVRNEGAHIFSYFKSIFRELAKGFLHP
jgi:hypothetical protein